METELKECSLKGEWWEQRYFQLSVSCTDCLKAPQSMQLKLIDWGALTLNHELLWTLNWPHVLNLIIAGCKSLTAFSIWYLIPLVAVLCIWYLIPPVTVLCIWHLIPLVAVLCIRYLIPPVAAWKEINDEVRAKILSTFNELHWKLFDIMCDQCWGQWVASRAATPMYLLCLVVAWKSMRSGLFPFRAEPQLQRSFQGESDLTKEKSFYAFQKIFSILISNKWVQCQLIAELSSLWTKQ